MKYILIFIIFLYSSFIYSQDTTFKDIIFPKIPSEIIEDIESSESFILTEKIYTKPIYKVDILDSSLIIIIDSILIAEKRCNYFSEKLCISMRFGRAQDSSYIKGEYYYIKFEPQEKDLLIALNPIGYFQYRTHYIFIYDRFGLPEQLFSFTKISTDFGWIIREPSIDDDSFSMYFFWYVNNQFYFDDKVDQCK